MEDKLVEKLSLEEAKEIMPKIGFGMEKILAATEALEMGVSEALIANGQRENPISSAIEHNKCTVISKMSEDKFLGNLYQRFPVTVDRGIGAHVWDTNNKEYIDCMGGYGVALLGHQKMKE